MASAGLVVVGFLITLGVDRVGGGKGSGDEKVSGGDG
jgi:hypothetical protein